MIIRSRRSLVAVLQKSRVSYSTGSASGKLFADAKIEEAAFEATQKRPKPAELAQAENWDGEERIQDAVLRMLIDKYKPLRSGSIQSADAKLKEILSRQPNLAPARILPVPVPDSTNPSPGSASSQLPPSATINGEHKPYLVTFRPPSHATLVPTIKYGHILPPPVRARDSTSTPISSIEDPRARAEARRQRKLALGALRLTKARDSTLDYRLGGSLEEAITSDGLGADEVDELDAEVATPKRSRAAGFRNPVSMRAWNGLIEDKIERARAKGQFDNLSGRGKPLVRDDAEGNPFIAREEFLMNRIVKRNGAAPPWVEVQQEMNSSVTNYRKILRDGWTRRVIRTLTLDRHPSTLVNLPEPYLASIRDAEWESREVKYHEHLTADVNALIRKYNASAPYAVRKSYIQLRAELDDCFTSSAPFILSEIRARADGRYDTGDLGRLGYAPPRRVTSLFGGGGEGWVEVHEKPAEPLFPWTIRDVLGKLRLRSKSDAVSS